MAGLIHVGAWDGREYVNHDGPLVLFEPQTEAFRTLVANVGHKPNVVLANCALGAEPGTATMHVSEPSHSSSLLTPKRHLELHPNIRFEGSETGVKVSTLDLMMRGFGLSGFTELVLDVQGYELEVLKGARETLHAVETIQTEVNVQEVYEGCALLPDLDAFLSGFERVETDLHGPEGAWGDAVYRRR